LTRRLRKTASKKKNLFPLQCHYSAVKRCTTCGVLGLLALVCTMASAYAFTKYGTRSTGEVSAVVSLAESAPKVTAPCQCEEHSKSWKKKERPWAERAFGEKPKCYYFALGANDGDAFHHFRETSLGGMPQGLANYAEVAKTNAWSKPQGSPPARLWNWLLHVLHLKTPPEFHFRLGLDHEHGSECEAFLVEANPSFAKGLNKTADRINGKKPEKQVTVFDPNTAYMCEGTSHFYIDSKMSADWEAIASSMSNTAATTGHGGREFKKVSVPTINLIKLLYEHVLPDDFVILDMDIEGAEFDILPCLARSPAAELVDAVYMEVHDIGWSLLDTTAEEMKDAVESLMKKGVVFPDYTWGAQI